MSKLITITPTPSESTVVFEQVNPTDPPFTGAVRLAPEGGKSILGRVEDLESAVMFLLKHFSPADAAARVLKIEQETKLSNKP